LQGKKEEGIVEKRKQVETQKSQERNNPHFYVLFLKVWGE